LDFHTKQLIHSFEKAKIEDTKVFLDKSDFEVLLKYYVQTENHTKAIEVYEMAIDFYPQAFEFVVQAIQSLNHLQRFRDAMSLIDIYKDMSISIGQFYIAAFDTYKFASQGNLSYDILKLGIEHARDQRHVIFNMLSLFYYLNDDLKQVYQFFKTWVKEFPQRIEAHIFVSNILKASFFKKNDTNFEKFMDKLTDFYDSRIKENSLDDIAWYVLYNISLAQDNFDVARERLNNSIAVKSDEIFYLKEKYNFEKNIMKDHLRAIDVMQMIVSSKQAIARDSFELGNIYFDYEMFEAFEQTMYQIIEKFPEYHSYARYYLINYYFLSDKRTLIDNLCNIASHEIPDKLKLEFYFIKIINKLTLRNESNIQEDIDMFEEAMSKYFENFVNNDEFIFDSYIQDYKFIHDSEENEENLTDYDTSDTLEVDNYIQSVMKDYEDKSERYITEEEFLRDMPDYYENDFEEDEAGDDDQDHDEEDFDEENEDFDEDFDEDFEDMSDPFSSMESFDEEQIESNDLEYFGVDFLCLDNNFDMYTMIFGNFEPDLVLGKCINFKILNLVFLLYENQNFQQVIDLGQHWLMKYQFKFLSYMISLAYYQLGDYGKFIEWLDFGLIHQPRHHKMFFEILENQQELLDIVLERVQLILSER
jgi:hypothetical protein